MDSAQQDEKCLPGQEVHLDFTLMQVKTVSHHWLEGDSQFCVWLILKESTLSSGGGTCL